MSNLYIDDYTNIEREKRFIRETIDGLLNRISVTDDENERDRSKGYLDLYIDQYIEKSRAAHNLFKEINKQLENK